MELFFEANPRTTRIVIGEHLDFAKEIQRELSAERLAIIMDERLSPLEGVSAEVFSFYASEQNKNRAVKEALEDKLLRAGFGRDSAIIGFGGGVTTDLAGFLAATFCRGVPFIAVPTTLMGMVDAAIGGKTGVNTPYAKNAIGAFHPPQAVLIDTTFLSTLPDEQFQEGLAEIVKYALIASEELFELLLNHHEQWKERDPAFLQTVIERSCAIKAAIVQRDPWEKGLRRILNFGHTVGHALEIVSSHRLSHGRAVAIGMMEEAKRSCDLTQEDLKKIERLYTLYNLPCELPYSIEELSEAMKLDKKNKKGHVRMVTLERIGSAASHEGVYCA